METKKTKRANLEKQKGIFLQIGFIVVLGLALVAFEWGTNTTNQIIPGGTIINEVDTEEMIITRRVKPPPPPPKERPIVIVIVPDEKITEEYKPIDVEANKNTRIEIPEMEEEKPEICKTPWILSSQPKFRNGGKEAFWAYIQGQAKYPKDAKENTISGTVYISFIVNTQGKVTNVQIARSIHPSLDNEARRVIENSPTWTPGEQMGKKVSVAYTIPVKFKFQN